jgi:hypothetical protein
VYSSLTPRSNGLNIEVGLEANRVRLVRHPLLFQNQPGAKLSDNSPAGGALRNSVRTAAFRLNGTAQELARRDRQQRPRSNIVDGSYGLTRSWTSRAATLS